MCIIINRKWRNSQETAQNIIILYDIMNDDQKVKDITDNAVMEFSEEKMPLQGNLYYLFMLDLCQCHIAFDSPLSPDKDNSDALLIFIAHVFGYKASSYADFMKLKNSPEVMEKYNKAAADIYTIATMNPDKLFLPELLKHCSKTLMKSSEYTMKTYGSYMRYIKNIPHDHYHSQKWQNIIKQSYQYKYN